MRTTETVHFRLLQTPCCSALLCWVNPRLPNYCPECGKFILAQMKTGEHHRVEDLKATLKVKYD